MFFPDPDKKVGFQQGQFQGVTTFVALKGRTYQVLTVAGQGNLEAVGNIHRQVMGSAKEVTDPAILNVRAPQLKMVKLTRAMTGEEFYSQFPSVLPLEEVMLINGIERSTQLPQGMMLKQVVAGAAPTSGTSR